MVDDVIKQLLEAGVHFGHQTKRWNPKMSKFIFGQRSGVHIIDLEKTAKALKEARDFLKDLASKGEAVLFVGTKKQAQEVIKQEAQRCGMFYVKRRWLGGLLTNFTTIRKSIARLKEIEKMRDDGVFENLSKKEVTQLNKEMERLIKDLEGVRDMEDLPSAMFVIDSKREETAVREANRLSIPVVALIDTNCDPDLIDFPIPGNDDAMKSIRLVITLIADSVLEGRNKLLKTEKAVAKVKKQKKEEELAMTQVEEELIPEELISEKAIEEEPKRPLKTKMRSKEDKDRKVK